MASFWSSPPPRVQDVRIVDTDGCARIGKHERDCDITLSSNAVWFIITRSTVPDETIRIPVHAVTRIVHCRSITNAELHTVYIGVDDAYFSGFTSKVLTTQQVEALLGPIDGGAM